ncbi:MAG TPA: tetratricopeptide repeat protein, partial [Planctomycetota bacterium]|nr:tetratricopeptide repeat protein [Planctomycetota bacterium]
AKLVSRGGDPESTEPMIVEAKFREALALDGRNYHASFGLAQFLRFMDPENTRDEVIRLLETTLAVAPRHADAREELGAAQLAAGRWADAERSLARALEIRSSGRTLYNLGLAVLYQGRGGEARKHLESALGFLGEDGLDEGNVRGYLVFTYLVEGNVEGARSLYARDRGRIAEGLKAAIESRLQ